MPNSPHDAQHAVISSEKREQIVKLIAQGENLDLRESEPFTEWMEDAYEALRFLPFLQQRFHECCRSSRRSNFAKVCLGVLVLRLVIGESS
ncbi:MAG: hypothetical protein RDU20_21395 [Desulfomonilaceae bacterium]|nr:hypothetical protein [Desulfomonilaceae bacterium]